MRKKVGSIFAGLLFAVLGVFLAVEGSDAFCIINNTDAMIYAEQTYGHQWGRGYRGTISSGDMVCIDWKNETVNVEGKRNSILKFSVGHCYFRDFEPPITDFFCWDYPIKAGGDLVIKGKDRRYKCEAHDY